VQFEQPVSDLVKLLIGMPEVRACSDKSDLPITFGRCHPQHDLGRDEWEAVASIAQNDTVLLKRPAKINDPK
jgi:hypothetical protein